ncbi:MAG: NUDIX domain-containing protein [Thermoplasmata archaeon]|nr:NUDIX domain-containing protein [Thermoplasmata archaeon]
MRRTVRAFRPDRPVTAELAAGAVVVLRGTGRILLLHQSEEDRWCFPKGHVEQGESLRRTAQREVAEETGLTSFVLEDELGQVAYRFFRPRTGCNVVKTTVYFLAFTDQVELRLEPLFDRADWFSAPVALARVAYDTDREMIVAARARLRSRHGARGPGRRRSRVVAKRKGRG